MSKQKAINRIVIGDVGSGKTIVAFILALAYLKSLDGGIVAMIAPTEVLAYQHYKNFLKLYKEMEHFYILDCNYLSGEKAEFNGQAIKKKEVFNKIQSPNRQFWFGTHALLFQPELKPDLILVDEQHRFGVQQRLKLNDQYRKYHQQNLTPHFISFSATPIPRTLALTYYSDLTPSFIQKVSSRNPIQTTLIDFEKLDTLIPRLQIALVEGKKVYVVCAKREDKEEIEDDLWSVVKAKKYFQSKLPKVTKFCAVHGKDKLKKDILQEFKDYQGGAVMIATSVIEVGIDVSEATTMIILNADRFGLAALHQIRGRIGRNNYLDNQCFLVTISDNLYNRRLNLISKLHDGFKIAEEDLKLRGSGDLLGVHQSGYTNEISELLEINKDDLTNLKNLAGSLDYTQLNQNLPRLEKYIQAEIQKIWKE
jgi:ATP-dependent DNA helicase RecG